MVACDSGTLWGSETRLTLRVGERTASMDGSMSKRTLKRLGMMAGMVMMVLGGCASSETLEQPVVNNPFNISELEYKRIYGAARKVLEGNKYQLDVQDYRYGTITTKPQASPTIVEPWYAGINSTMEQAEASTIDEIQRVVTVRLSTGKILKFELGRQKRYTGIESEVLLPDVEGRAIDLDVETGEGTGYPVAEEGEDKKLENEGVVPDDKSAASEEAGKPLKPIESEVLPRPGTPNPVLPLPERIEDLKDGEYYLYVKVDLQRLVNTTRYLNGRRTDSVFAELAEVPIELRRRGVPAIYWETTGRDRHLEQRLLKEIIRASFEEEE